MCHISNSSRTSKPFASVAIVVVNILPHSGPIAVGFGTFLANKLSKLKHAEPE